MAGIKSIYVSLCALVFAIHVINSSPIDNEIAGNSDISLKEKLLLKQVDKYDKELDRVILDLFSKKRINKRSDIDARLLELQAKIMLAKAYADMPAGHGRFNFEEIGKRSVNLYDMINEDESQKFINDLSSQNQSTRKITIKHYKDPF